MSAQVTINRIAIAIINCGMIITIMITNIIIINCNMMMMIFFSTGGVGEDSLLVLIANALPHWLLQGTKVTETLKSKEKN